MKKPIRSRFAFTLIFVLFCGHGYSQNIIQNGGFETATIGMPGGTSLPFYPATLNSWSSVNVDGEYIKDGAYAHSGTGFLSMLQNSGGNPVQWWLGAGGAGGYDRAVQIVPVSPSTSYRLQFYIRSGEGLRYATYGKGYLLLQVEQFQPTYLKIDSLTALSTPVWQPVTLNFTTGPLCTSIAVLLSCFSPDAVDMWYDDIDLRVAGTPPVSHFNSNDSAFCDESGKCINFTDLSTGNPTSWEWHFQGAVPDTSTLQNPADICYYTPGTYSVTLITKNAAGSDTLTISPMITFSSGAATPVLTLKNDTIFCSHESAYQWYFNGMPITGATDSFYVATLDGYYAVQITDSVGCKRLSSTLFFVSANELAQPLRLTFYPTILRTHSILRLSSPVKNGEAIIYDMLGKEMMRKKMNGDGNHTEGGSVLWRIEKGNLVSGVYFVRVNADEKQFVQKIIVE